MITQILSAHEQKNLLDAFVAINDAHKMVEKMKAQPDLVDSYHVFQLWIIVQKASASTVTLHRLLAGIEPPKLGD